MSGTLRECTDRLHRSPVGWTESGEPPFGSIDKRGWVKSVGTGRMFEGTFLEHPALQAVQEAARPLAAELYDVDASALNRVAERVSVKPSGCPALQPHIDYGRKGGWQVGW